MNYRQRSRQILDIGLVIIILLLMPSGGTAARESKENPYASAGQAKPLPELHLADIIPCAAELSVRLAALEQELSADADLSAAESRLNEVAADLKEKAAQLEGLKDSADFTYAPLIRLGQDLKWKRQPIERAARPVVDAIGQLETRRSEWLTETRRWQKIGSELDTLEQSQKVGNTLAHAQATIARSLDLIRQAMEPLLALQEKAAELRVRAETMAAEVNRLVHTSFGADRADRYPPLISPEFVSQAKSAWQYQMRIGLGRIDWRFRQYSSLQGGLIIFQAFLALVLIIGIQRQRKTLERTERLKFLAQRPFAAGVFVALTPFYNFYTVAPGWLKLIYAIGAAASFLRLTGGFFEKSWKKQALYALVFFLISARALSAIAPPLPIIRLFVVVVAAAGIYFCLYWARAARRQGGAFLFTFGLRLGACVLAIVLAAQLWGKSIKLVYLLYMPASTIGITLAWWLLMRLARGLLEWIVRRLDWHLPGFVRQNPEAIIRRASALGYAVFGIAYLCAVLVTWDLYPDPMAALAGLLNFGVTFGSQQISVGLVAEAALLAYGAFVAAWAIQNLFLKKAYDRRRVDPGVRFSINRLITLAFGFVGFLLALGVLGFKITQLTIIIGALGVGIGFGLQDIFNNFICGLILLFERPMRVGDTLELQGQWAEVTKIGLRSTQIRTYDNADVIVPNNDLVSGQVINWTLSSRMMRIKVPVGVVYGSDIPLVIETLLECAKGHTEVAVRPEPVVLFLNFGDSSLNFELRFWILNFDEWLRVQSELNQEIDQRFRRAGIEIAFPQRDLHLRSVDDSIKSRLPEPAE